MIWIEQLQSRYKRACGQIAVAALTGASIGRVVELVGHAHGSKTVELRKAMISLGWRVPLITCKPWWQFDEMPQPALGQLRFPGHSCCWHWVAISENCVADGCYGAGLVSLREYTEVAAASGYKLTSYLPVYNTSGGMTNENEFRTSDCGFGAAAH